MLEKVDIVFFPKNFKQIFLLSWNLINIRFSYTFFYFAPSFLSWYKKLYYYIYPIFLWDLMLQLNVHANLSVKIDLIYCVQYFIYFMMLYYKKKYFHFPIKVCPLSKRSSSLKFESLIIQLTLIILENIYISLSVEKR